MPERIQITSACDALRNPHLEAEKLQRLDEGASLLLLTEYPNTDFGGRYFEVALGGRPVFVPKSCGVRVHSQLADPAAILTSPTKNQNNQPVDRSAKPARKVVIGRSTTAISRVDPRPDEGDGSRAEAEDAVGHFVFGLVAMAIGGGITLTTYSAAGPGETYWIAWGPVLYGGYRVIRGIIALSSR